MITAILSYFRAKRRFTRTSGQKWSQSKSQRNTDKYAEKDLVDNTGKKHMT